MVAWSGGVEGCHGGARGLVGRATGTSTTGAQGLQGTIQLRGMAHLCHTHFLETKFAKTSESNLFSAFSLQFSPARG